MLALQKRESGKGLPVLTDVPVPRPGSGEVLLKIAAAGICGTDIHIVAGERPCNPPVILGHEFSGTIIEIGAGVTGWAVGDRVTSMPFAIVCGICEFCLSGEFGLCLSRKSYGSRVNGAFAEYMVVNASRVYRLPAQQDFVGGALTEPLACVTKAVFDVGGLRSGEVAAILGPGPIGLLTTQVVNSAGARGILIGLKGDKERLDLGQKLGAQNVFYADEPGVAEWVVSALGAEGVDIVFECSGAAPALDLALKLVRRKGRIIQVGLFGKSLSVEIDTLVFKDLTYKGSFTSYTSSWKSAIELTGNRQVDTRCLVSDILPLEAVEQAFALAVDRNRLKVVFQP
jgi:L-iditol 2-dehydrogenase